MLDYDLIKERLEDLKKIRDVKKVDSQIAINEALLETFFKDRLNPRPLSRHHLQALARNPWDEALLLTQ